MRPGSIVDTVPGGAGISSSRARRRVRCRRRRAASASRRSRCGRACRCTRARSSRHDDALDSAVMRRRARTPAPRRPRASRAPPGCHVTSSTPPGTCSDTGEVASPLAISTAATATAPVPHACVGPAPRSQCRTRQPSPSRGDEVHVRAVRVARIALDPRAVHREVDVAHVVDADHDVRVAQIDRRRAVPGDVVRRADHRLAHLDRDAVRRAREHARADRARERFDRRRRRGRRARRGSAPRSACRCRTSPRRCRRR